MNTVGVLDGITKAGLPMFRTVVNGLGESEVVPLPNPRVIMLLGERPKPSPRVSVPIAIPPYVARTTEVGALLEL